MEIKKCFKCLIELPLSAFYKHSEMKDGHLNKCKECTKKDSNTRFNQKLNDCEWVKKEKKRNRIRMRGKSIRRNKKREWTIRYFKKFPEKRKATMIASKIKPPKGFERHHWSYNEAHYEDVIFMIPINHKRVHRYMVYDQQKKMYRRSDNNVLLDTREEHEKYSLFVIDLNED